MSPTQRALERLHKEGWTVAIVEHFNSFVKRRFDLFGWCDILAVRPLDEGMDPHINHHTTTLGVQVTTADHLAERRAKMSAEPRALICARAGWSVEAWGVSTRRAEAGPCKQCNGEPRWSPGEHATRIPSSSGTVTCRACRGTGKGKRPLKKVVVCIRWRMDQNGEWSEM